MPVIFHILAAVTYIALGVIVAFALPQSGAGVGQGLSLFIGGGVLLIGALAHQSLAQMSNGRRLALALESLHHENAQARDNMAAARAEVHALAGAIGFETGVSVPPVNGAANNSDAEKSAGDLKLLRTLLDQLPSKLAKEAREEIGGTEKVAAAGGSVANTLLRAAADYANEPVAPKSEYRADWVGDGGRTTSDQPLILDSEARADGGSPVDGPLLRSVPNEAAPRSRTPSTPGQTDVQTSLSHRRQPAGSDVGSNAVDILETTRDALERARVSVFLQPTVQLPNRRVSFYEAFSRIRDRSDNLIGPHSYLELAERAGLIAAIDNNLLFRCVQLLRRVRRFNRDIGFFCNVSAHTLLDETFFPQFLEFLADNTELAEDLIFEFSQADVEGQWDTVGESIERLSSLGFRFSMDQVDNLSLDLRTLTRRNFGFVKLDAGMLLQVMRQDDGPRQIDAMIEQLTDHRITLIVEKVDTERELVELLDHNIHFGQGYLFGEPRESKALQ